MVDRRLAVLSLAKSLRCRGSVTRDNTATKDS